MLEIRSEEPNDTPEIHLLNREAFEGPAEAELVDVLREAGALTISLVAVVEDRIVGHIALSPVDISSDSSNADALGLGPMAVLPDFQRAGIGSQLVEAGLRECEKTGLGVVVVLGHPAFYPRFGFTQGKLHGIEWEHEAPEEAFMVKELKIGALAATCRVVRYRPEFGSVYRLVDLA